MWYQAEGVYADRGQQLNNGAARILLQTWDPNNFRFSGLFQLQRY